jgi:heptosyltransferase-2
VLPNSLKSALLPFLASIPRRVGYLGEARVGLLTHRLKNPEDKPPMVAFYSALSGEAGCERTGRSWPCRGAGRRRAAAARPARGGYVVMAPGAEYGPAKRWPHFGGLAALLDRPVLLLGSGKEARAVRGDRGAGAARAATSRADLADGSLRADRGRGHVVSNDSGLMHVAAAFGVPQVALFGRPARCTRRR